MRLTLATLALTLAAPLASAACFADYKAQQRDPLELHYGIAEIRGDCTLAAATEELRPRLAEAGWELLNVVTVFDDAGLDERRANAGDNYLRY